MIRLATLVLLAGVSLASAQNVAVPMGRKRIPQKHRQRLAAYLAAQPALTTNVMSWVAVRPPVPTNSWIDLEPERVVIVRGRVVSNYQQVAVEVAETMPQKFRRSYYRIGDAAFLARLRAWERNTWQSRKEAEWQRDYPAVDIPEE